MAARRDGATVLYEWLRRYEDKTHALTHTRTKTPKAACQQQEMTALWIEEVNTDREVMANRTDIIKNRK